MNDDALINIVYIYLIYTIIMFALLILDIITESIFVYGYVINVFILICYTMWNRWKLIT